MHSLRAACLLALLLLCGSSHLEARHARGGASASGGGGTAPSNVEVILQGQNQPVATSSGACVALGKGGGALFEANWNEIGWIGVAGATQYNIYRATNGGSYPSLGSPTYTVTAATAASNYATYAASYPAQVPKYGTYLGGGANGQGPAPNIAYAYTDTAATAIIGNGGAAGADFAATATVTASSTSISISAISSGTVATGQGIGDAAGNIPLGTTLVSGPGGTGTYTMSQAATGNGTNETVGAVMWGNQAYTYKVSAVVGGVESALSTDAILPFMANGYLVMSNGTFDSCIGTNQTGISPASPLGYTAAVGFWPIDPGGSGPGSSCGAGHYPAYMNAFSGNSAVNYNLNVGGYKYLNIALMPNTSGNGAPTSDAEICGDAPLVNLNATQMAAYGPAIMTANAWNIYKIPVAAIYYDSASGVPQTAMYKITWGWNPNTPSAGTFAYVEYYWSVN